MNIEELEDEERTCYICGAQGCMFEFHVWNWVDEGESFTVENWWTCDAHQAPVIDMLATYLNGYRSHIVEYDKSAIDSGMNLKAIETREKKERKRLQKRSENTNISLGEEVN